jgi:hypothetical protein
MHKKPIYDGICCDHGNRRYHRGELLNNVFISSKVICGAAQDMDLFMHTRPLWQDLFSCKIYT